MKKSLLLRKCLWTVVIGFVLVSPIAAILVFVEPPESQIEKARIAERSEALGQLWLWIVATFAAFSFPTTIRLTKSLQGQAGITAIVPGVSAVRYVMVLLCLLIGVGLPVGLIGAAIWPTVGIPAVIVLMLVTKWLRKRFILDSYMRLAGSNRVVGPV